MDEIFKPVERITELVRSQIEAAKSKTGRFPKVCSNLCLEGFFSCANADETRRL